MTMLYNSCDLCGMFKDKEMVSVKSFVFKTGLGIMFPITDPVKIFLPGTHNSIDRTLNGFKRRFLFLQHFKISPQNRLVVSKQFVIKQHFIRHAPRLLQCLSEVFLFHQMYFCTAALLFWPGIPAHNKL